MALLPKLTSATGLGSKFVDAYAAYAGVDRDTYLEQLGSMLTAEQVAAAVIEILTGDDESAPAYLLDRRWPRQAMTHQTKRGPMKLPLLSFYYSALRARISVVAPASEVRVRTWFQNVQLVTYRCHVAAAPELSGSTRSRALLRGTW